MTKELYDKPAAPDGADATTGAAGPTGEQPVAVRGWRSKLQETLGAPIPILKVEADAAATDEAQSPEPPLLEDIVERVIQKRR